MKTITSKATLPTGYNAEDKAVVTTANQDFSHAEYGSVPEALTALFTGSKSAEGVIRPSICEGPDNTVLAPQDALLAFLNADVKAKARTAAYNTAKAKHEPFSDSKLEGLARDTATLMEKAGKTPEQIQATLAAMGLA